MKIIYNQYKKIIREIQKQLYKYKKTKIIKGHLIPNHIDRPVNILPKMGVSNFKGNLKGKSAFMIFDRHTNLKYKSGN